MAVSFRTTKIGIGRRWMSVGIRFSFHRPLMLFSLPFQLENIHQPDESNDNAEYCRYENKLVKPLERPAQLAAPCEPRDWRRRAKQCAHQQAPPHHRMWKAPTCFGMGRGSSSIAFIMASPKVAASAIITT